MERRRRGRSPWNGVCCLLCAFLLFVGMSWSVEASTRQDTLAYLSEEEHNLLSEMFDVHMAYFLSSEVITAFGFPMTAYKVGDRARYGYSNPTEWGYAWQAWIAAAERGLISTDEATQRLKEALQTLDELQQTPEQSYHGFPYPFYKMTTSEGDDLTAPDRDPNPNVPSGDNALLYASLVVVEGWARVQGEQALWELADRIRSRMDFSRFMRNKNDCLYLAHAVNADTGELSASVWDIYADEGGVAAWIAWLSGSVDWEEYVWLTECQHRRDASWTDCMGQRHTVEEAAWFNSMFAWAVRSLAGFPIGDFDAPHGSQALLGAKSLFPAARAHLAYGDCLGLDHPAFSDAMSQADEGRGLVAHEWGWHIPPNLPETVGTTPHHAMPHALFVPFNALPDLSEGLRARLVEHISELRDDAAGYHHTDGDHPFGFEVVASPYRDDLDYCGADEGRLVFETLSQAYIVLSLFNALQLSESGPRFATFAMEVPGYEAAVREALQFLYPCDTPLPDEFQVRRETGDVLTPGAFYGKDFRPGGADLAEWVAVREPVEPGQVLEIDPTGIGQYRLAQGPCTVSVAGVVSTQPGMVLGDSPDAEGQALLALLGVVPVKVTDEGGPIAIGDLLIVSSTPGYAMRWDPDSGQPCGLVGKALEPHHEGAGMIEVLLTR